MNNLNYILAEARLQLHHYRGQGCVITDVGVKASHSQLQILQNADIVYEKLKFYPSGGQAAAALLPRPGVRRYRRGYQGTALAATNTPQNQETMLIYLFAGKAAAAALRTQGAHRCRRGGHGTSLPATISFDLLMICFKV